MLSRLRLALPVGILLTVTSGFAWTAATDTATTDTVESRFPRLSSGPLREAVVVRLYGGVALSADGVSITRKEITQEIAKAPASIRQQLTRYGFFMLEQMATRRFITKEAKDWASENGAAAKDEELVGKYLESLAAKVVVSDEEVSEFFKENAGMFGNATFDQVKGDLRKYLEGQKRTAMINDHLKSISTRHTINVSAIFASQQYRRWIKNPVEQARRSGKPILIDFGADGCRPCDMMAPMLKELREEYKGRTDVVFVHVRKQQILAAHYGVSAIPMQVIFDKDGREAFRHVGFLDKQSIVEELGKLGVK